MTKCHIYGAFCAGHTTQKMLTVVEHCCFVKGNKFTLYKLLFNGEQIQQQSENLKNKCDKEQHALQYSPFSI